MIFSYSLLSFLHSSREPLHPTTHRRAPPWTPTTTCGKSQFGRCRHPCRGGSSTTSLRPPSVIQHILAAGSPPIRLRIPIGEDNENLGQAVGLAPLSSPGRRRVSPLGTSTLQSYSASPLMQSYKHPAKVRGPQSNWCISLHVISVPFIRWPEEASFCSILCYSSQLQINVRNAKILGMCQSDWIRNVFTGHHVHCICQTGHEI
jgi:hypothetical protein